MGRSSTTVVPGCIAGPFEPYPATVALSQPLGGVSLFWWPMKVVHMAECRRGTSQIIGLWVAIARPLAHSCVLT